MTDFRKIQNMDEYESLVKDFVEERQKLRDRIDQEQRGIIATQQVDGNPVTKKEMELKPVTDAISNLKKELKPSTTFFNVFEKYANNPAKKTSEVRAVRRGGKAQYIIGENGVVNTDDIEDDVFRIVNKKTGKSILLDKSEQTQLRAIHHSSKLAAVRT